MNGTKGDEGARRDETPTTKLSSNLERELPVISNDLAPLSLLVERVVDQAYVELANLAEVLPSTEDAARKRAIVDYVLQTRRQILKLLVLVRWSSDAGNIAKCMSIIAFLSRQNFAFDQTVSGLTEVKSQLASARVRNYDLPTAISVLTTGTYNRLPSTIQETFSSEAGDKLGDGEVLRTLRELDEVIRWKLSYAERVPKGVKVVKVADGRATLRVEDMWEATLTYGGDLTDPEAQWYLLTLKFLFRVCDARGVWSNVPAGPMKDHIVELCNQELAKRRPPPAPLEPNQSPPPAPLQSTIVEDVEDAPLIRGYNFLQHLCLKYQLEALYTQALQLASSAWAGSLRVEYTTNVLRIEYWTPPPISKPPQPRTNVAQAPPPPPPPCPNYLTISIGLPPPPPAPAPPPPGPSKTGPSPNVNPTAAASRSTSVALTAVSLKEKVLENLLEFENDGSTGTGVERQLTVCWGAEGISIEERKRVVPSLIPDLDLEKLLVEITALHAKESVGQLYRQLDDELDEEKDDELELVFVQNAPTPTPIPSIRVRLYSQYHILLSINIYTGRLELKAEGDISAQWETRLRNAADKLDRDRKMASETIARVRASAILDEVDSRASYLGLQTSRRLPIRSQDLSKFGLTSRMYLFVHLQYLSNFYLVLVLNDEGFRFALISVREVSDAVQSWLSVEETGWLDKPGPRGGEEGALEGIWGPEEDSRDLLKPFGFNVSIDDLRDLHLYCVRRIAFFKIETQLHLRRISFKPVSKFPPPSSSPSGPTPTVPSSQPRLLAPGSPYLVIQSSDLLQSNHQVAFPNIPIQCDLVGNKIRTTMHVRFRDLELVHPDPSTLPPSMVYNRKTSIVAFTGNNIDTCIPIFLMAYSIVARTILLARNRQRLTAAKTLHTNEVDVAVNLF